MKIKQELKEKGKMVQTDAEMMLRKKQKQFMDNTSVVLVGRCSFLCLDLKTRIKSCITECENVSGTPLGSLFC